MDVIHGRAFVAIVAAGKSSPPCPQSPRRNADFVAFFFLSLSFTRRRKREFETGWGVETIERSTTFWPESPKKAASSWFSSTRPPSPGNTPWEDMARKYQETMDDAHARSWAEREAVLDGEVGVRYEKPCQERQVFSPIREES